MPTMPQTVCTQPWRDGPPPDMRTHPRRSAAGRGEPAAAALIGPLVGAGPAVAAEGAPGVYRGAVGQRAERPSDGTVGGDAASRRVGVTADDRSIHDSYDV